MTARLPARDHLHGLNPPEHITLKLIGQENRGPGAARNRALNDVSPDTLYIAFLDSADRWTEKHLSNALYALAKGYDFLFADHWHPETHETFWSRNGQPLIDVCMDRGC